MLNISGLKPVFMVMSRNRWILAFIVFLLYAVTSFHSFPSLFLMVVDYAGYLAGTIIMVYVLGWLYDKIRGT